MTIKYNSIPRKTFSEHFDNVVNDVRIKECDTLKNELKNMKKEFKYKAIKDIIDELILKTEDKKKELEKEKK